MAKGDCGRIPHRYVVAFLCFLGLLVTVGYRESFAVIVTHISSNLSESGEDSIFQNCTVDASHDLHVGWSSSTGQLLHTSFFVGQFIIAFPSGLISSKLSPKRVMGFTLLGTSILFLLLSEARKAGLWLVFVMRVIQGIIEGIAVPSMNALISKWARKKERARLISIAYAGAYLSPAVASISTGATICFVSWDSIMYITGSLGVAWSLLWFLVVIPSPEARKIDPERQSILRNPIEGDEQDYKAANQPINHTDQPMPVPWKSIFKSMPVYAIWVCSFCRNFIFSMLISEVPQYFKDGYNLSTSTIGVYSALPHVCMVVFIFTGSVIFDKIVERRLLSVTWARKLAQLTGYGVQGGCTLAIGFVDNYKHATILLCVGAAFSGFAISGFQTNPLDLAPEYAGQLTGIFRTGMLGAVVSTYLASQLPGHHKNLQSWQEMFLIAGAVHLFGVVFYLIFASGERQSWAPPRQREVNVSSDASSQPYQEIPTSPPTPIVAYNASSVTLPGYDDIY